MIIVRMAHDQGRFMTCVMARDCPDKFVPLASIDLKKLNSTIRDSQSH
jgi:hypothetical protein